MKKLFLTLIALVATSGACFAQITLKDAYEGLADLPGMKAKTVQSVNVDGNAAISNVVSASAQASSHLHDREPPDPQYAGGSQQPA